MKRRPTFRARRGVVLMVILSLLVLFALLGVTFAIVAGQYRKAASSFSRRDQYGDEPGRQIDSAMYMVLRDTPNPRNPIRTHSLLTDIYGLHSDPSLGGVVIVKGTLASALTQTAGNQFLEFRVTPSGWPANAAHAGYFNGCVLTFTSGKLRGVSTRVVGYGVDSGVGVFRVLRPTMDDANLEVAGVGTWATAGDTVLINGRAFSGTGAGYNTATGKLDATDAVNGGLLALSPNRTGNPNVAVGSPGGPDANSTLGSMTGYLAGGANEPYDAPDFQNMFLAAIIPDPTNATGHGVKLDASGRPQIIPSFHRPALLQNQGVKASTIFRPMPNATAGPNFPPLADPIYGPWDVDNDGDGLNDSIWLDLDFPMQTSSSGRAYRPLFAIMCLDMDGRLNINYQGNFQQITTSATSMADLPLAGGTLTSTIPTRGAGLGPGEVNLKLGWGLNDVEYRQLLEGNNPIYGRYGGVTAGQTVPTPGGSWDALDITRFYEIPSSFFDFYNAIGSYSSYQSPADLQGQLVTGVDHRGQLQTSIPTDVPVPGGDRRFNTVYRTRVSTDQRFTAAELERMLRHYDIDSPALPKRIEKLTNVFNDQASNSYGAVNRRNVTTHSYDLPVATAGPNYVPPGSPANTPPTARLVTLVDLLRQRMPSASDAELVELVDPTLFHGLKMDLNRPLGDGVDNDNNGVVDEIGEANNPAFDLVNGSYGSNQAFARFQLAKHLYILASLVTDNGSNGSDRATQFALAQWAVNVVDFRDADSIMTPFSFDVNMSDGWQDSEASGANAGLVWGCERPELLLTETLNLHDRRTSDTADEMPTYDDNTGAVQAGKPASTVNMPADPMHVDQHFDQKYLPQGSSFIEIYNPWTSMVQRPPAELYGTTSYNSTNRQWNQGVRLDAVTPGAAGSPVWRILIVKGASKGVDPDEPDTTATQVQPADIDRSIYFTDIAGKTLDGQHGTPHYTTTAVAPLKPGRYAVIGSGPETPSNNEYITYAGFLSTVTDFSDATLADLPNTRQIVLTPNANPDQNQFTVRNNASTTRPEPNYGAQTQPVIAAVINKTTGGAARRFSISEPVGGYTVAAPSMLAAETAGLPQLISPPLDIPLDFTDGEGKDVLMKDGTKYQHRVLHLQRLANPLQPFNATTNPYRTIDTIGADLTCFNGVESKKETTQSDNDKKDAFESLQRGDPTAALPNPPPRQLWKRNLSQTFSENQDADTNHYWPWQMQHTLGYLNSSYAPGPAMADMATDDTTYPGHQRGDLRVGPGESTFPLLMWNNRPFNSVYELLNVPRSHSSTLLKDFTTPTAAIVPYNNAQFDYGHLFNFYFAPQTVTLQPGNPQIGQFYRIFDYLRVPSKFVESDSYFPFSNTMTGIDYFRAPFNRYSNFRDPGLININTVYSEQTWNAILNGATGPTFADLVASRRGYGGGPDQLLVNNAYPTEFANPFRPSGFGQLAPIPDMEQSDIESTLLRSRAPDPTNNTPNAPPLLANTDTAAHNDVNRHAAFRQQTIERLSNTLTTRSNVYAVWVTIGYFEVDPTNGLLGQELYSDTGEVKRHRGFYLIDRSIPVGFEPGENHNVDRSILLRRFIE